MISLTDFLLARIAEDEAWAKAAMGTPGAIHWHWVDSETDMPVTPDPFTQAAITDEGAVSLRTIEELEPVSWGGGQPLPDFVIWNVDDMLTPGAAGHIARHDPARVLAECEAKRGAIEAAWADHVQIEGEWGMCQTREQMDAKDDVPDVIALLALPYADHPDYRQEWRP